MVKAHTVEQDALIGAYVHLQGYPMEQHALETLRRVGSLVKPIMRKHGWRISKLAEFYPEPSLWGLNTSYPGTSRLPTIQLRLRQPHDHKVFLPYESVVDTMVHELTHCRFGPHDDKFWKMYRELKREVETLIFSGYTGEGFLSQGRKLGATPSGLSERERLVRAREERSRLRKARESQGRTLGREPGRKVGSSDGGSGSGSGSSRSRPTAGGRTISTPNPPSQYATPNQLAAEAAIRRNYDKDKNRHPTRTSNPPPPHVNFSPPRAPHCPGVRQAPPSEVDQEIALMNGFTTVAEMEDANEAAILQAAIELLEEAELEDETTANTIANRYADAPPPLKPSSAPPPGSSGSSRGGGSGSRGSRYSPIVIGAPNTASDETIARLTAGSSNRWACKTCTFVNEEAHLQCICGEVRPDLDGDGSRPQPGRSQQGGSSSSRSTGSSGGTGFKGKSRASDSLARIPAVEESYWACQRCDNVVSHEWWSCTRCGCVKLTS